MICEAVVGGQSVFPWSTTVCWDLLVPRSFVQFFKVLSDQILLSNLKLEQKEKIEADLKFGMHWNSPVILTDL